MKRILPTLIMLLLIATTACNPPKASSLNTIVELYGGRFSLESGIRANTSEGKINYAKLICEDNKLISNGWLSPEAMAKNCAFLLTKSNPDILEKNDVLEIEFSNSDQPLYLFKKKDLKDIQNDYNLSEKMIVDFINMVNTNKFDHATNLFESSANLSESNITAFLKTFKNVVLTNYKETKLIGFSQNSDVKRSYVIDFFIISQDDVQKMAKAIVIFTGNGFKFSEVTY